ncbi:SRPBCC domain-containing protein [Gymnodinialimonas hymeniacidonis]|uniref:SRPBCC family protein n=1 Tax=Gymnodinialimonas hymeniacidonis TaxID=3126508 RepID=UPI0034C600BB
MTTASKDLELTCTRTIAAPPEALYDAWLDAEKLAQFMRPGASVTIARAENDPRLGGRFDIVMQTPETEIPHWGIYQTLDRPNRIVFTWNSPFTTGEDSTVTLDFTAVKGGTEVRLHHIRFPSEESRKDHEAGWGAILATLSEAIA